ncbi:MAG TPA: response regulator [Gammaproteobacteria bacterium]|nr:response regulator [Gammaproteobacteria bacterium]
MSKARILIADNDRLVLTSLARELRNAGYTIFEVNDGCEAIRLCAEKQPDIAVLDIRMPDMDGIEIGYKLQKLTGTPFLMLSAYGDSELVEKATDLGALGYLIKPIDIKQLIPTIEAALKRSVQIKKLQESESRLVSTLKKNQLTSTAVGVVMERHHLSRDAAFEKLRKHARSERRKLTEIAAELVKAVETANISNG